jgi:hypothetical protein
MPILLPTEQTAEQPLSPGRPLTEQQLLDPTALGALREFFLILDAWDRAQDKKLSTTMHSPVDNPSHQAQGGRNIRREK